MFLLLQRFNAYVDFIVTIFLHIHSYRSEMKTSHICLIAGYFDGTQFCHLRITVHNILSISLRFEHLLGIFKARFNAHDVRMNFCHFFVPRWRIHFCLSCSSLTRNSSRHTRPSLVKLTKQWNKWDKNDISVMQNQQNALHLCSFNICSFLFKWKYKN